MKRKKIKYKDAPPAIAKAIEMSNKKVDILPSPRELVESEKNVQVNLTLNKRSVERFKNFAKKHGGKYQKMIRGVVDYYADNVLEYGK